MEEYLIFLKASFEEIKRHEAEIKILKDEIYHKSPFKVGDIVMYNDQKAFISEYRLNNYNKEIEFQLMEVSAKGTKGRKIITYFASLNELTKISDSN